MLEAMRGDPLPGRRGGGGRRGRWRGGPGGGRGDTGAPLREMAYVDVGAGPPSCSCTATRPRPTCGATSSRTARAWAAARPDLIGMGDSDKLPTPARTATASSSTAATSTPGSTARPRRARHAGRPRLGLGPRLRLGPPPPRRGAGHRLHGGDRAAGDLGRVARGCAPGLPGLRGRRPARRWCWRRTCSSSGSCPRASCATSRRGDGRVPAAVRRAGRGSPADLTWPREIPIDGEPADVVEIVEAYGEWLRPAPCPSCSSTPSPGSILIGPAAGAAGRGPTSRRSPSRQPLRAGGLARTRSARAGPAGIARSDPRP